MRLIESIKYITNKSSREIYPSVLTCKFFSVFNSSSKTKH